MAELRPLIYGYMRVDVEAHDVLTQQREQRIRRYAEMLGFELAEIIYEYQHGYYGAWRELIEELQRSGCQHVVLPTLDDLATHPIICDTLIHELADAANAELIVLR